MAIQTGSGFNYAGGLPNFERDRFVSWSAMNSYSQSEIEVGHIVYVRRWGYINAQHPEYGLQEIFERGLQTVGGTTPATDAQHPSETITIDTTASHIAGTHYVRARILNNGVWSDGWVELSQYLKDTGQFADSDQNVLQTATNDSGMALNKYPLLLGLANQQSTATTSTVFNKDIYLTIRDIAESGAAEPIYISILDIDRITGTASGLTQAINIQGANVGSTATDATVLWEIQYGNTTYQAPITLVNTNVTAGSYPAAPGVAPTTVPIGYGDIVRVPSFTVDAKGRLTAAGSTYYEIQSGTITDVNVTPYFNSSTPNGTLIGTISVTDMSTGSAVVTDNDIYIPNYRVVGSASLTTGNAVPILISNSSSVGATNEELIYKNNNFTYNPSEGLLSVDKITTSGDITTVSGKFVGSGAGLTNIPITALPVVDTIRTSTAIGTADAHDDTLPTEGAVFREVTNKNVHADEFQGATVPGGSIAFLTIDSAMSGTSTNAVQNKVVKAAIDAKYSKPVNGIPRTDLAENVTDSLDLADTALQQEDLEDYARIDGSYDTMSVGLAKNLEGDTYVEGKTYFKPTATVIDDSGEFTSAEVGSGPASIETIQGNSAVWNSLVVNNIPSGTESTYQTDLTIVSDGHTLIINGTTPSGGGYSKTVAKFAQNASHYYYFSLGTTDNMCTLASRSIGDWNSRFKSKNIVKSTSSGTQVLSIYLNSTYNNYKVTPIVIDLTLLGIDNLTTTDQVEDWLSKNIGAAPYYAYNAGTIINSKPTGMAGIGYNLMSLSGSTGTARIPGKYDDGLYGSYYGIAGNHSNITFTDAATGYTTSVSPDEEGKFELTKPGTITVSGADSTTTVFMWYDGSNIEESVPYERTVTTGLDVTKIYGKVNGGGSYVQVFPDGLKGIGELRDILDLRNAEATVYIGSVDLGTLAWYGPYDLNVDYKRFITQIPTMKEGRAINAICPRYVAVDRATYLDKVMFNWNDSVVHQLNIIDMDYASSTAGQYKAAMNGVILYYELATPITYTDLIISNDGGQTGTPVQPFTYEVDNWGLEELLPQNDYAALNGIVTTAPILNVKYSIDAVEAINTLNDEVADLYESKPNKEGYYPGMAVGLADNLKGDDVVTGEFLVRTTGGEAEVANGTASLDGVKGNSVKWNQTWNVTNGLWSSTTVDTRPACAIAIREYDSTRGSIVKLTNWFTAQLTDVNIKHTTIITCTSSTYNIIVYHNGYTRDIIFPRIIAAPSHKIFISFVLNSANVQNGISCSQMKAFDLTAMGIDNLTTTDEVEAWLAENIGTQSYYPYNAGEVINVNMTGLESTGFNLLNPETHTAEIPGIYTEDYDNYYGIAGTYTGVTFTSAATGVAEDITSDIDEEGKVLIEEPGTITVVGGDATSCVFLWYDGSQTESEPYVEPSVARIDVNHIKGIAVGGSSTEAETIFPYGMCGIGDIKDEIFTEEGVVKAVKRIGVVDLGDITWNRTGVTVADVYRGIFDATNINPAPLNSLSRGLICSKYPFAGGMNSMANFPNGTIDNNTVAYGQADIVVKDSNYPSSTTTPDAFKTAMSGVKLYYELATPITYTSLQYGEGSSYFSDGTAVELPINYTVNNWGIERILPANTTSAILTAKPTVTCEYATDVLETINTINDEIDNINASLDEKVDKVGAYPELMAGNLVNDTPSTGTFTYRKAGGDKSIASGTAVIDEISGKTLVWNQQIAIAGSSQSKTANNVTITDNRDGSYTIVTDENGATDNVTLALPQKPGIVGHVYLETGISGGSVSTYRLTNQYTSSAGNSNIYNPKIFTCGSVYLYVYIYVSNGAVITTPVVVKPQLIDLTAMFGAGNEPSTVEEFEALYPLDYYDYNAGALVNNNASAIETIGFNQWDEETKYGTHVSESSNYFWRPKNLIRVIPSTTYYIFFNGYNDYTNYQLCMYDINQTYIGNNTEPTMEGDGRRFTTFNNAYYFSFEFYKSTPYSTLPTNIPICINLSDPAKNGTYEPYEKHTFYFDKVLQGEGSLATVTGKLNGEGESVVVFPDGLRKAGNVFDEIKGNVAIKRIGSVDLGTLTWTALSYNRFSSSQITDIKTVQNTETANIICTQYMPHRKSDIELYNKTIGIEVRTVYVCDSAYSDAETFKTAMSGVMLYYELATPETYILDQTVTGGYQVNALGTEKRLPEDTASAVTAPIILTTRYSMDAVGTLNGLPTGYISESSMDAFLAEFASKIGAAINKTITATKTFDAATNKYNFTITVTNPS